MNGDVRKHLAALGALADKTDAAERQILELATQRILAINREIRETRPRALIDEAAGEHYQRLIVERGTMHQVIARARRALGQT